MFCFVVFLVIILFGGFIVFLGGSIVFIVIISIILVVIFMKWQKLFVNGVVIDVDIFLVFGKYSGSIVLILNFRFVINNVNYNDGVVYWFVVFNVVGEMISNGLSFSIVGK